jgi:hypothetical protein
MHRGADQALLEVFFPSSYRGFCGWMVHFLDAFAILFIFLLGFFIFGVQYCTNLLEITLLAPTLQASYDVEQWAARVVVGASSFPSYCCDLSLRWQMWVNNLASSAFWCRQHRFLMH